jgi:hypothetical protein
MGVSRKPHYFKEWSTTSTAQDGKGRRRGK